MESPVHRSDFRDALDDYVFAGYGYSLPALGELLVAYRGNQVIGKAQVPVEVFRTGSHRGALGKRTKIVVGFVFDILAGLPAAPVLLSPKRAFDVAAILLEDRGWPVGRFEAWEEALPGTKLPYQEYLKSYGVPPFILLLTGHEFHSSLREWARRTCPSQLKRLHSESPARIDVSAQQWNRLWAESAGLCAYCGRPMAQGNEESREPTVDHIIPISELVPGFDVISEDNLIMACRECNTRKHHLSILGFVEGYKVLCNSPKVDHAIRLYKAAVRTEAAAYRAPRNLAAPLA